MVFEKLEDLFLFFCFGKFLLDLVGESIHLLRKTFSFKFALEDEVSDEVFHVGIGVVIEALGERMNHSFEKEAGFRVRELILGKGGGKKFFDLPESLFGNPPNRFEELTPFLCKGRHTVFGFSARGGSAMKFGGKFSELKDPQKHWPVELIQGIGEIKV